MEFGCQIMEADNLIKHFPQLKHCDKFITKFEEQCQYFLTEELEKGLMF